MCTLVIDSLNGVAHHIAQNVDLVIVAAADPVSLRKHARRQGWDRLRLLSTAEGSTFKYDLGGEDREGNQDSTLTVITSWLLINIKLWSAPAWRRFYIKFVKRLVLDKSASYQSGARSPHSK